MQPSASASASASASSDPGSVPPPAGTVQIEERGALGEHARSWDALVAASQHPTPFASSWCVEHLTAAAGRCCWSGEVTS